MALAADIRICAEDAQLGDPRSERAIYAATGVTNTLPRIVGYGRAIEMMLLAQRIDGREAQRIGAAYRAVPEEELASTTEDIVQTLARSATKSIAVIKAQLAAQMDLTYEAARAHSIWVRNTYTIEDSREGVSAFLEKRTAHFTGR